MASNRDAGFRTTSKTQQPAVRVTLAHQEGDAENELASPGLTCAGVSRGRFMLEKDEVDALVAKQGASHHELLVSLIRPAAQNARPPVSSFKVGAVGLGGSGNVYVGVNLELLGLPLFHSVHAEQFLVVNALSNGETVLRAVAISAAPCGHCRQFFCELSGADDIKFLFGDPLGHFTLEELLPFRFSPRDLLGPALDSEAGGSESRVGEPGGTGTSADGGRGHGSTLELLMEPRDNGLALSAEACEWVEGVRGREGESSALVRACSAALTQANMSYAPYSKCPSAVALVTRAGDVYAGGYIESAAYNPSLPPLQSALVQAVANGMPSYAEAQHVILAELQGGAVGQEATLRHALETIAPQASLHVLHLVWQSSKRSEDGVPRRE